MNTLIFSAIFAVLISVVACEMNMERSQKFKDCMAETRTTEDDLKAFFANGMNINDAKENLKCNIMCVMTKNGHFQGGVFNDDAAIKDIKDLPQLKDTFAEVEAAIKECKTVKGTNDCDTAFKIFMCLKDHKVSPKSYM